MINGIARQLFERLKLSLFGLVPKPRDNRSNEGHKTFAEWLEQLNDAEIFVVRKRVVGKMEIHVSDDLRDDIHWAPLESHG